MGLDLSGKRILLVAFKVRDGGWFPAVNDSIHWRAFSFGPKGRNAMEENRVKRLHRRRVHRIRKHGLSQSLIITSQVCPEAPRLQLRSPEEVARIAVLKWLMTVSSLGYGEAAKEIRRPERGDTFIDEFAKGVVALVFEGIKGHIESVRDQL